jgi:uncharacterized membrane protein
MILLAASGPSGGPPPIITNDAVVFGILAVTLGAVFWTSSRPDGFWKKFYTFVPSLLLCYFIPSLLRTWNVISPDYSNLYFVASRYLLPTSLVLLTISVDLKAILRLGPKAIIMFLTGTAGVVVGGPLAILLFSVISPETIGVSTAEVVQVSNADAAASIAPPAGGTEPQQTGSEEVWRGLTTVAGSWIGGGANQAAMKEVFDVDGKMFSVMIAVDVIVANVWMAVLLFAAGRSRSIDRWNGADATAIDDLKDRVSRYQAEVSRIPSLPDVMIVLAVGFGATGVAHYFADLIAPWIETHHPELARYSLTSGFFWFVVIATTLGVLLSFSPARRLEGAGASRLGSAMIYVLVATIGMSMDLNAIKDHPGLFALGLVWIGFHAFCLIVMALIIKAPVFYVAVGSQANIGGAASAPIVASAFSPALAPVGVLLAVLGYAVGTYAAWGCGLLMQSVSP